VGFSAACYSVLLAPIDERLRRHLGPIIAADGCRHSSPSRKLVQDPDDTPRRDRGVDHNVQDLPHAFVEDVQRPKPPSCSKRVATPRHGTDGPKSIAAPGMRRGGLWPAEFHRLPSLGGTRVYPPGRARVPSPAKRLHPAIADCGRRRHLHRSRGSVLVWVETRHLGNRRKLHPRLLQLLRRASVLFTHRQRQRKRRGSRLRGPVRARA
jgi:hypothetical protein